MEEKFRVYWDGIACWPYLSHNLRTLKKQGINMVASSYGKAWAIEYEDLDGMARAYCFASTNGATALRGCAATPVLAQTGSAMRSPMRR